MDFSSGGKRLSGFLKWWLLAEWIIREVVIRKVEMIRRAQRSAGSCTRCTHSNAFPVVCNANIVSRAAFCI